MTSYAAWNGKTAPSGADRFATGRTSWEDARSLTDRAGVPLEEAMTDVDRGEADLLAVA